MMSNYPPGVSGNEPQITGEWPVDPHQPYFADETPLEELIGEIKGFGIFKGDDDLVSTHPSFEEAGKVAFILNDAIPNCHFRITDKGRSGCLVCGEPDWDQIEMEQSRNE